MMQHKYPFVILHLEINPEMIDINVHPAKMDIRFTNQNYFYDFITSSIYQRLKNIEITKPKLGKIEPNKYTI